MTEGIGAGMPRVARIASSLGKFAPSCVLAGLLGIHIGLIPPLGGFMFFQIGLLCALFALGFGITTLIVTRSNPEDPARSAGWLGMASGALVLTATVAGMGDGGAYPPINDITTDLDDPPAFARAADVPDFEGRDMSYPVEFVAVVRANYSDLEPLRVDDDPATAYSKAVSTVQGLGWEIVHQDAQDMTLNARETSTLFEFVDDIVVRVRPDGSGAVVDLRSKSRDGRGDLGVNAKRIGAFTRAFGG
ncbi:MAG: DUF1499 domain-containing protein [bacterium]|nr:DUF1499 domain-containing protein [bacterium]